MDYSSLTREEIRKVIALIDTQNALFMDLLHDPSIRANFRSNNIERKLLVKRLSDLNTF